ncbi:TPA: hypothetical protein JAN72_06615 [Legionella pneumophila]|uniref:Uncharacterized protein n=1 Tax=Legionella pneumophila TaxID=446 RepID=A0AAN5KSY9_LEGPN|nr:hypothetical protein [Legionella pneumophila]HAT1973530.1 hypothetical protein [Legionella pneumophila]HAT6956433.1 hypothetical protein [Legionella pneumophila]HEN4771798.1 hypothetical protein [Legionella pneumophila]
MKIKKEILNSNDFQYHFKRDIYYNKLSKKIFSTEIIQDNTEDWLVDKIQERNNTGSWQIYFNDGCTLEMKNELISELDRSC